MRIVVIVAVFVLSLVSCENKESLQKYFVENSESQDFIALDLAPSFINTEKLTLTSEEKEALSSFKKLNVLAYKNDSLHKTRFEAEKNKVKGILKEEAYEPLMKFGNTDKGLSVYLVGNDEKIDEFVLFASGKEEGFVVARLLGDNMKPTDVVNLVEVIRKADLDLDQLKPLKEALK
ncbi:DUF4252 domain-containing protein [Flavobacterium sp. NRK F10]|uniref:DUF4252 domain-containing protein n=1 Tax=Flavobacterium sp. NRK F10 TaxID=2954931 RepID=UPI0020904CEB|nr:DUF4252 domain-containing protein [Flavobacterium sp. NRK F10]MCO6173954.1 DUF4252 domain-containing protein [Flavobacterium sp. NRK F10]